MYRSGKGWGLGNVNDKKVEPDKTEVHENIDRGSVVGSESNL